MEDSILNKTEKILLLARKQFKEVQDAEHDNRAEALENLRFTYNVDGGQWDDTIKAERVADRRPCLTHNKLRKFVSQVANRERANRLKCVTIPVDDKADIGTSEIYSGLLEQIQHQSKADQIYSTQGEKALAGGWGYWRILTKYADDSFEQDIIIEGIDNQFSVYLDPERKYGFIRKVMLEEEFDELYPDAIKTEFSDQGVGDDKQLWYADGTVTVAEYFKKEPITKTLAKVESADMPGSTKVIELTKELTAELLQQNGFNILKTREVKSHKVMWRKITATEILEEKEWVGSEIPIIEVKGDEVNISGKVYKRALVADGKDPQIMYNYSLSAITEKIGLAPKAPFIVSPEMIKGHQEMWDDANVRNYPYLVANETPMGFPKRQESSYMDSGLAGMLQVSNLDIKDCLGQYESSIGEVSNERSGKAINARSNRSDMGTFHFPDNLGRAILETCRQIVEIIPKVFDTERIVRIKGETGDESLITINQTVIGENGEPIVVNDLSVGKYDVRESIRAWGTRREEAAAGMMEAMQYAGDYADIILPYVFEYQDFPGAEKIKGEIEERRQQIMAQNQNGGNQA